MNYAKSARTSLTRIGLLVRVFFLSLLLMGSTFTVVSTMVSSRIFAQGAPKVVQRHVTRPRSLTQLSTKKKLLSTQEHLATQVFKGHRDRHNASVTSKDRGALDVTPTPTPTPTATPTATPVPPLGLSLVATVLGGPTFEVGQTLVTRLDITNTTTSTTFDSSSAIVLRNILALGNANIVATGSGWNFTLNSTTGPALLSALYAGPPVVPGGTFPTIQVSRSLTNDAVPVLTGNIALSDGLNPNTALATTSVRVYPSTQTPTVTPTVTSSVTPTPTLISVPGISMSANFVGGPNYQVGQNLVWDLNITNTTSTTTLDASSSVGVGVAIPLGLNNLAASGNGWYIVQNVSTGPGLFVIVYTGSAIAPGGTFPPLEITGLLTSAAVPTLIVTSGVSDLNNPGANTITTIVNVSSATPTATITSTATPTATAISTPTTYDEAITANVVGGPGFQVGQTLTWDLNVSNASPSTSLDASSGVEITDIIPLGLSSVAITGNNWTVSLTSISSPALFTATYTGPAVTPGSAFPALTVTGVLTSDAIPTFTNTAAVSDTISINNYLATFGVNVSPANQTVTVTPTLTATATVIPTVTPTLTATAIPTITVTVAPTPTATWSKPQLYIANSTTGSGTYVVGQTINYALLVTNLPSSFAENQSITVQDVFSVGLTDIIATGSGWTINMDNTTSPTLMTATYNGPYPVASGALLPMIFISGHLTAAAAPSLTSDATVSSADDPNPLFDTSVNTITVLASPASPTVTPTAIASVTPTIVASVTPTMTLTPGTTPDLSIVKVNLGGDHFKVGDKVTYVIIVSNASADEAAISPITVSDIIPLGLNNIAVKAPHWNVSVSNQSSPTIISADYNGSFPVVAGEVLPAITITGTLNDNAVPSLTDTATVDTLGDSNVENNQAIDTVFVKQDEKSHHNSNTTSQNDGKSNNSHNNGNGDSNSGHNNGNGDGNSSHNNGNGNSDNSNNSSNGDNGGNRNSSSPALPATGGNAIGSVWLSQYIQGQVLFF